MTGTLEKQEALWGGGREEHSSPNNVSIFQPCASFFSKSNFVEELMQA
jgi:hypothetical protein